MGKCENIGHALFSYETPKIITIRSLTIGVFSRIIQLLIIGYIIGYVIVYQKGYQDFSDVQGSVVMKMKGVTYTNFSDDEFNPNVIDKHLYRRIWDVADYVVPPSESGSIFVATNVIITSNQKLSTCAEDITIKGAPCDPENNTCEKGSSLPGGNGVMTGECMPDRKGRYSCQIHAWCPVEVDEFPLLNNKSVLGAGKDFTLLIKNFVEFPKFKGSNRRNIKDTSNSTYLQSCRYDEVNNKDCPVFVLGDIVAWAGEDYEKLALKGGVIGIVINWDCNFDFNWKYCFPTYRFYRMDDRNAKLAPGWNFRYAQYYADDSRTLFKMYGIKFSIVIQGRAGKFKIIPLLLNIGAGLGLLSLNVVLCDVVVLYLAKRKELYKSRKYESVADSPAEDYCDIEEGKCETPSEYGPYEPKSYLIDQED